MKCRRFEKCYWILLYEPKAPGFSQHFAVRLNNHYGFAARLKVHSLVSVLKTLIKFISFGLLSVFLSLMLFSEYSYADISFSEEPDTVFAVPIETPKVNQNYENEDLNADIPMNEENMKELFGDDQVFPFVAGLDSY